MKKLIDYLYQFQRRPVYAVYDIKTDFGFACMDKASIAIDLGFHVEKTGSVYNVVPHPFASVEEVHDFPWNISLQGSRAQRELGWVKEWIEQASVHQGGGCFGPLTVAACILGVENCTRMVRKKPDVFHAVLEYVTKYMVQLAQEEEKMGADSFWIAEPVASLFSPKNCRDFCTPYLKKIFDSIQVPGILHVCGNTDPHLWALLETGAQGLSIDWCTDLVKYIQAAPEDVVIMGNIDPMLLWKGTKEEIAVKTRELLEQTRDYKNFVLASGCQIPSMAQRENVELMVNLGKEFPVWSNEEYQLIHGLCRTYCNSGREAFETLCSEKQVSAEIMSAAKRMAENHLEMIQNKK